MAKWTTADIPDQTDRVVVVTGANTGLGYDTALALAEHGAHVVLAVRNLDKGKDAAARITAKGPRGAVELQELDLSSLDSVRAAAEQLRADHDHFELQFGTNHLGHFAFTGLLLDRLLPVAGSRVVTVSSIGHRILADIHFDDLQWERSYNRVRAYGQAKLANLLFTYELQRRLAPHGTTIAAAAHPGGSSTELARDLPWVIRRPFEVISQDAAAGALPTLRAATDATVTGGQYYGPDGFAGMQGYPKVVGSSKKSHDADLQRRLWTVSEELTGVKYPI
jgi:NAD(P)-dependent dehydrogenase (short-subunit alcohol dehydrogenase family)